MVRNTLLSLSIPSAFSWRENAVFLDPGGILYQESGSFRRSVLGQSVLPLSRSLQKEWNPFSEIRLHTPLEALDAFRIAYILIHPVGTKQGWPLLLQVACQRLLQAMILHLCYKEERIPRFPDLLSLCHSVWQHVDAGLQAIGTTPHISKQEFQASDPFGLTYPSVEAQDFHTYSRLFRKDIQDTTDLRHAMQGVFPEAIDWERLDLPFWKLLVHPVVRENIAFIQSLPKAKQRQVLVLTELSLRPFQHLSSYASSGFSIRSFFQPDSPASLYMVRSGGWGAFSQVCFHLLFCYALTESGGASLPPLLLTAPEKHATLRLPSFAAAQAHHRVVYQPYDLSSYPRKE